MRILMMTNTYTPVVGGMEESIRAFTDRFRERGHKVMIVAPEFENMLQREEGVVRIPAIQKFNRSDFSVNLPIPGLLPKLMHAFKPDIVHSHHPFLIGDIALRLSGQYSIPLIFTYHTMFEEYLHYLPFHNEVVKRFVIELAAGYASLTDQVVVPSESIRKILLERGVEAPINVVPTGVDADHFAKGKGRKIRDQYGIPQNAFVVGLVGRLAAEKNLEFLATAVSAFMNARESAHFLIVGKGPFENTIKSIFINAGLEKRVHFTGLLRNQELIDSYHAMDIFAFSSHSETQGLVITEASAAGIPIVAIDAPGVREVVKDGKNGRLIYEQDQSKFVSALSWCADQDSTVLLKMKKEAQRIAKNFSIEDCTTQILGLYEKARTSKYINRTTEEHGTWQSVMHRIKTEWDMLKNMAEAGQAALHTSNDYSPRKKFPDDKTLIKSRGAPLIMKIRRWLSRSELSSRLLGLSKSKEPTSQPGLVLIQIDGFSMTQLNRALKDGEMPFLKKLLNKERYNLYPYYSGLPSSTPSIQGELFYGVKGSVPSFSFLDHKEKKVLRMYDFEAAVEVERRLAQHNKGLLEGGSSYSNIFAGGAQESHFCAVNLGWHVLWKGAHPLRLFILALTHIHEFIRTVVLMAVEMILAIIDFIQGLMRGENLGKELKFIPTRAGICIMLRDLITIGAKIDISRGLPVVHMNFLGYDEQAHRRGPTTSFAHWALQGIDASVAKIYRAALRSTRRNYDVWIYSDHGQEGTLSYAFEYGRTIQEAVASVFENFGGEADSLPSLSSDLMKSQYRRGIQFHRARYLGGRLFQKIFRITGKPDDEQAYKRLVVTAMGPIGHIYIPLSMEKDQRNQFARRLVIEAKIPLVLAPDGQGQARCWNESGEFILPAQAKEVLGENHPYLTEVTQDLKELCHHPNAGTLIISGWRPNLEPYSFPIEGGAHGGPGSEETNAFAILPSDIVLSLEDRTYLRTKDLREAALSLLEGFQPEQSEIAVNSAAPKSFAETRTIRIMTYNVHSCIGMDGKITPERIARVIGRHEPDIVALQELDMRRPRTGGIDQPHLIARHLAMIYHFYPTIRIEEERYGNAVLSRYPMKLIYAGRLPGLSGNNNIEPRGAIWSTVDIGNTRIQLINTHLGLRRRERLDQVKAILGKDWLSHPDCSGPVVLCGDFNALPRSPVCRRIRRRLRDAQSDMEDHRPRATWFGHFPMGRIDHVFVGPNIEICHVEVSRTELDKIASDHLPLIVDIKIPVHL